MSDPQPDRRVSNTRIAIVMLAFAGGTAIAVQVLQGAAIFWTTFCILVIALALTLYRLGRPSRLRVPRETDARERS